MKLLIKLLKHHNMKKVIFQEPVWADSQLIPLKTSVAEYAESCRSAGSKAVLYQIGVVYYGAGGEVSYLSSPPVKYSIPKSVAKVEKKYAPQIVFLKRPGAFLRRVITSSLAQSLRDLMKEWPQGFTKGAGWELSGDNLKDVRISNEILLAWAGLKNKKDN